MLLLILAVESFGFETEVLLIISFKISNCLYCVAKLEIPNPTIVLSASKPITKYCVVYEKIINYNLL